MQENEPNFEKHIDDIVKAIGDKLERNVIANELRRYVDEYGIDLSTAKESIVRKHYGNPNELSVGGEKLLAQVGPGETSVSFKAKIISVYKKEINTKEGSKKIIYEGEIGDASSRLRYTFWNDEFKFQPNDVVEISNAYTKSWNDIITVNIGDRAIMKNIEDNDLKELDLGVVKTNNAQAAQELEVVNLKPGMRNVSVKLRVIDVEPRTINIKGEQKVIFGGNIGDKSGTCRFTSWEDHNIVSGKAYSVENAYVKEFNGPDLQFGEYSKFTELEEDELPSLSDYEA